MVVEVAEFVGQDVCVRAEIESILAESFLKPDYVKAKSILAGDLVTLREVIDLLVLIKTLILIAFARATTPEKIPFVRVGRAEAMLLEDGAAQLVIETDHFVEQLRVLNMVTFLVAVVGELSSDHLLVCYILEMEEFALVLVLLVVEALASVGSL